MSHPVAALVRDLYAMRQADTITDAEAHWILSIVLPEYGLSLRRFKELLTP